MERDEEEYAGGEYTGGNTARGTESRTLHILPNKPPTATKVQRLKHIFVATIGAKRVEYVGGSTYSER